MTFNLTDLTHQLAGYMLPAMAIWLAAGLTCLILDGLRIRRDRRTMNELADIVRLARSSDHVAKTRIQNELVVWADGSPKANLRRWIYALNNTVLIGNQVDAMAMTEAIGRQEMERQYLFRFFARQAIVLGLFFTSVGLCATLADVVPAIMLKTSDADAWLKGVQAALSQALVGMSGAFYSSLAGISIALFLNGLALAVQRLHAEYVHDLDAFLQGSLVPVFTAIAEKDRNDIITETMDWARESFREVRNEYRELLAVQQAQQKDLGGFRELLQGGVENLGQRMEQFANQVSELKVAAGRFDTAGSAIGKSIDNGIERLAGAHQTMLNQVTDFQEDVLRPLTEQVSEQFDQQQASMKSHSDRLAEATTAFKSLSERIAGQVEAVREAASLTSQSLSGLTESVTDNSGQMRDATLLLGKAHQAFMVASNDHQAAQTTALQAAADDQRQTLARMDDLVKSLSVSGEAIQHQLTEVYGLHQQAVSQLYAHIAEDLGRTLQQVAERGAEDMVQHLTTGVQQAIGQTHDRLTGLDDVLKAIAKQQGDANHSLKSLQETLSFNGEALTVEIASRRQAIDVLLKDAAGSIRESLERELGRLDGIIAEQLQATISASIKRQEDVMFDFHEAIGKRWDDLLLASTAGMGLEVEAAN